MNEPSAITIAHVSDIHVGAHDDTALEGLAGDLRASGAAATVVTGDLTMRAKRAEFVRAMEVIDEFPAPTLVVLGNHDITLTNPLRRLSDPYGKYRAVVSEALDPALHIGPVWILGLQSMPRWRWKSGRVSDRQTDLIRSTFQGAPSDGVRIVALHHPPSLGNLESIANRAEFEQALIDAEIDIVLAGHTHRPQVQPLEVGRRGKVRRTIIEVVAGTATSHRTRGVKRSWSELVINRRTLTITEHTDGGSGWHSGKSQTVTLNS